MKKKDLQQIAAQLKPSGFTDARNYLKEVYQRLKASQSRYSYEQFTEDCGMGSSNGLYFYVNGKRPITLKAARKLADGFGLTGDERAYFLKLIEYQYAKDVAVRDRAFKRLMDLKTRCLSSDFNRKQLQLFEEWYHLTILEILRMDFASDDPKWIGKMLQPQVAPNKVVKSLSLLQELQLITYDQEAKRLVPTQANLSTGPEIRGMVYKTYHDKMIHLALDSLSKVHSQQRDISSVTIAVSEHDLKEIKLLTAEFRQKLLKISEESQNQGQIMQVNIQAFPLSKTDGAKTKDPNS